MDFITSPNSQLPTIILSFTHFILGRVKLGEEERFFHHNIILHFILTKTFLVHWEYRYISCFNR
ncbi:hypothetical protein Ahy_A02g009950 isoform J [Arachis hypogaea]|uniref:Uncharacterized protein n=1 Tax=Arachis hypogaea TaxID=3818 RepID=A0A445EIL1_ARAHY|nr:hypothetical protein Ahy_A02g009950 isoform J [Arachis hypogaea]